MQKIQKFFSTVTFRIVASIYKDMLFFALVVYFFFLIFLSNQQKDCKATNMVCFFKEQRIFFLRLVMLEQKYMIFDIYWYIYNSIFIYIDIIFLILFLFGLCVCVIWVCKSQLFTTIEIWLVGQYLFFKTCKISVIERWFFFRYLELLLYLKWK